MESILFWVLIISGIAFVIQTIAGIIGVDDIDLPDDNGIFGFFTIRNLISFFLGFSVVAYLALRNGYSTILGIIGGIAFGIVLVIANMAMMRILSRLEQKNEIKPHDYTGIQATVTVKIPANAAGVGKVEFSLNSRMDEMMAVSNGNVDIEKGVQVQVEKLQDNGTLLVRRIMAN